VYKNDKPLLQWYIHFRDRFYNLVRFLVWHIIYAIFDISFFLINQHIQLYMESIKNWFAPRIRLYLIFYLTAIPIYYLTSASYYGYEAFFYYTLAHSFFILFFIFILSFYLIRYYFYQKLYGTFILGCFGLLIVSYLVAYYLYPSTPHDRVNFPYFVGNRLYVFFMILLAEFLIGENSTKVALRELQIQQQINLLNNQINPHLLFNEFNHLHYHVMINSDKTSEVLVKLSDLMRYSLKLSSFNFIRITDEINFLESYIDLEKIKLHDTRLQVNFRKNIIDDTATIPTMMLVVFVENAFKYGVDIDNKSVLDFEIEANETTIRFYASNKKVNLNLSDSMISTRTGIENVKGRLNLLLPNRHELEIKEDESSFEVRLVLNSMINVG
jgi:Histidine kinase